MVGDIVNGIKEWFYTCLYKMFACICELIDFLKTVFYKLCGIDTVSIEGEDTDLLSSLISSVIIKRTLLAITLIAVILLFVFTIIALIKSNYQEKQNWKTVLSKAFGSFIIMILVPFTILLGIYFTNTVMKCINMAMQTNMGSSTTMIGGQFLVTIGSKAFLTNPEINQTEIENAFMNGELDYRSMDTVRQYYDCWNLNYVIGIFGSLVILIMFALASFSFVQRIFDVVLLYILSPVSISTIPLDEGNRFKVWKDMMISKILSAYGVILTMNLFFLIIPQVYNIRFFENNFSNGIVYLLFLIGGAFAVTKANRLISQLTGSQPTGGELAQMFYNIRTGIALTRAVTHTGAALLGGIIGGSDYRLARRRGATRSESIIKSFQNNRNQTTFNPEKQSKVKKYAAMPLRIASMPLGMVHDFTRGGLITVGKNFVPRCKNMITGSTLLNHAEVKPKVPGGKTSPGVKQIQNTGKRYDKIEPKTKKPGSSTPGPKREG